MLYNDRIDLSTPMKLGPHCVAAATHSSMARAAAHHPLLLLPPPPAQGGCALGGRVPVVSCQLRTTNQQPTRDPLQQPGPTGRFRQGWALTNCKLTTARLKATIHQAPHASGLGLAIAEHGEA